jgi:hypothetical protein
VIRDPGFSIGLASEAGNGHLNHHLDPKSLVISTDDAIRRVGMRASFFHVVNMVRETNQ